LTVRRTLAAIVLLALPYSTAALAQKPAPQQPADSQNGTYTLKVKSQAVVLDVIVTNKKGEVVTGLTKDDFQVYEDKVPQTIRYFEAPVPHPVTAAAIPVHSTAELDAKEPDAPVTILVLDEINTKFEDEAFARYSLKKYLDTLGETLPQPTLLVAVDLFHFKVLRDYTTSKKDILYALDHHLVTFNSHLEGGSWKEEQFNAAFGSLLQLAEATTGHPGHKTMIWVGTGFPTVDPETLPADVADVLNQAIETCTNALRDARIVLYTLDPAGLSVPPPATDDSGFDLEDPFGGQVDFEAMARATGGDAYHGRNDVDNLIATSERDAGSFYTLSYSPSTQGDDTRKFRNINVRMKDPRLHAATRQGYYPDAPPPEPPQAPNGKLTKNFVFDLSQAAGSLMVYDGVPMKIERDPAKPDNFSVFVKSSAIPWKESSGGNLTGEVTLLVESFDRKGKLLEHKGNIRTVQITPADLSKTGASVLLPATVATQPPAARLRFVVRVDGTGKLAADNVFLVDKSTLADPDTGLVPPRDKH
jgi:VWFA-related protein